MVKIGGFEFTKPPDIFRSHYGRHSSRFFIAGSLPDEDYPQLVAVVRDGKILDLEHAGRQERVVVVDRRFTDSVVWGKRYELVLMEFKPIDLNKHHVRTAEAINLGEKMLSPRFKAAAELSGGHDEIPRGEVLDYRVDLRVDLDSTYESFKLRFMDQYALESSRKDFSIWTKSPEVTLEIFLGYLEQGGPISVAKGKVERISHGISASGTWVKLEGKGELRQRQQEYACFLKDSNFYRGKVERTGQGELIADITAPLLPDLKPNDTVDVSLDSLGTGFQMAKADSVTHTFKSGGTSTSFTFMLRDQAC